MWLGLDGRVSSESELRDIAGGRLSCGRAAVGGGVAGSAMIGA